MKNFFEIYQQYFYGIILIVIGIIVLKYMKFEKNRETEEEKKNKDSIDKNLDFRLYLGGYFSVISGIYILLRELFS